MEEKIYHLLFSKDSGYMTRVQIILFSFQMRVYNAKILFRLKALTYMQRVQETWSCDMMDWSCR